MIKKVYALFHQEPKPNYLQQNHKYEIKIQCNKYWMNDAEKLEKSKEDVMYYNENYFISFSRAALVRKAKEIQAEWIEKKKNEIAEIEAIVIK